MTGFSHEPLRENAPDRPLITAGIGLPFFVVAAVHCISVSSVGAAIVLVLSGAIIEGIACILFHLSRHGAAEAADFHAKTEAIYQSLLANSIAESLDEDMREQIRADLVRKIVNIHIPSFPNTSSKQFGGSRRP